MKARIPLNEVIDAALNNKLSIALQRILLNPDKWTVVSKCNQYPTNNTKYETESIADSKR